MEQHTLNTCIKAANRVQKSAFSMWPQKFGTYFFFVTAGIFQIFDFTSRFSAAPQFSHFFLEFGNICLKFYEFFGKQEIRNWTAVSFSIYLISFYFIVIYSKSMLIDTKTYSEIIEKSFFLIFPSYH